MMTRKQVKEAIIDNIIDVMIDNVDTLDFDLSNFRKIIDDSGQISTGTNPNKKKIVLYQEDHQEIDSTLSGIVTTVTDCYEHPVGSGEYEDVIDNIFAFNAGYYDATTNPNSLPAVEISLVTTTCSTPSTVQILLTEGVMNYLSQLITFETTTTAIDLDKAIDILDTDIFELIPKRTTQQERINKFFKEFEELKGDIPNFNLDVDADGIPDTWKQNIPGNQNLHHQTNDISDSNPTGNIVRLDTHAGNVNENQTLESLRNRLDDYLTDIDKDVNVGDYDERPEYENKSDGYVKIRGLNQAIVVRNEDGSDIGLIGQDKLNPNWLTDGFTITMWVKFLNKVSGGTLFNFGNPLREINPKGFALETYSLYKDGLIFSEITNTDSEFYNLTWGEYIDKNIEGAGGNDAFAPEHTFFKDSDYERFIRLVVREKPTTPDPKGPLLDSHTGISKGKEGYLQSRLETFAGTPPTTIPGSPEWTRGDAQYEGSTDVGHWQPQKLLAHTRVPLDLNGWYFIVANYNPNITEITRTGDCGSTGLECAPNGITSLKYSSDYWRWNVNYGNAGEDGVIPSEEIMTDNENLTGDETIGVYTAFSGFGAKCKVEIISRKDLLRARGFKPS